MPQQQCPWQGKMKKARRSCDEIGKQRHARMRRKKTGILWVERRMERFLYAGHINFRVFNKRMVSVHEDGGGGDAK